MSMQAVRDLWLKAQQDPALRQQLQGVKTNDADATIAAVVKIATATGFAFTAEEYEAALKEELARQHAAGQVSEEQLEAIVGAARAVPLAWSDGCSPTGDGYPTCP